jgi:hypothetical protein
MLPQLTEITRSDDSPFNYLYCLHILFSHNVISAVEITKFHFIVRCIAKHANDLRLTGRHKDTQLTQSTVTVSPKMSTVVTSSYLRSAASGTISKGAI